MVNPIATAIFAKAKQVDKSLVGYDATMPFAKMDKAQVAAHCKEWFGKFVFQRELSDPTDAHPEGYDHWQIRGHLIKKRRLNELKGKMFPGGHISITTDDVHQSNSFNYCMKADSRTDGPWTEADFADPPPLTRQLKVFLKQVMYPWQSQVYKFTQLEDDRLIHLVYDCNGNCGKSIFCEWLEYQGHAFEIPPFRQMEDIMQCVMSVKTHKCYIIDMPRAMKKDKMGEFYAGLECLKNGVCYDKRYAFKKKRFDRPVVVVFTNTLPEWSMMSTDRWSAWNMNPDHTLTKLHTVL